MRQIKPHPMPVHKLDLTPVGWRLTVSLHCGAHVPGENYRDVYQRGIAALEDARDAMRQALESTTKGQEGRP